MATCPACGKQMPGEFLFCPFCAAPLSAPASAPAKERKVVSVLFCDLVGFTAASESADPEEVQARLAPYHARTRERIEAFGGTVEKFIGDAVMAVFGAPVAHEDDPERAVRAGLAVLETIERLNAGDEALDLSVRVGVNTGEAVVALDARPELGEGMVTGDVVNTAARIQAAAPVGGVAVGESTFTPTKLVFNYESLGTVTVKGKSEPLKLWRAVAPLARFGSEGIRSSSTAMVGRERERALLAGTLERVEVERTPQLVTVIGVPGIGKSRLVQELVRTRFTDEAARTWLQGRCLPYGDGVSFWAVAEIVKAQAGIFEGDDPGIVGEKLSRAVRDVVADDDVARVTGALLPLVGLEADAESSSDRRDESFAAWRRFLECVADQRASDGGDRGSSLGRRRPARLRRLPRGLGRRRAAPDRVHRPTGVARAEARLGRREAEHSDPRSRAARRRDAARLIAGVLDRAVLPADTQAALLARAGGIPSTRSSSHSSSSSAGSGISPCPRASTA